MSLDAILEELQLSQKSAPNTSSTIQCTRLSGKSTLDQLDAAARDQYGCFRGSGSFAGALPPRPDYIKAWTEPGNIEPLGSDKYDRRVRLANGDDSDYEDDTSAADYAFVCDLLQEGFEPGNVEIIMRATRYRQKFDEMRGPGTYLARTLSKAMESIAQGKNPLPVVLSVLSLDRGRISIPITPPQPRDYVWQGRMVAGHAYVLGGFGGVSKSQAALQFSASIAMGTQFGNIATKKGSALLIFGEDDVSEITRRVGAYAAHEKLSSIQLNELEKNIRTFGLVGEDTRLTVTKSGVLEKTFFSGKIITAANELVKQSGEPIRLIVLDHAGLVHGGDFNAREDVSLTMRIVNHIAHETGAAVLLLAHSPKGASVAETSDAAAIAGSTAFVDQTRGAFILATMRANEAKALGIQNSDRQQYVSLTVVKNNYGKTGEQSWFSRSSPPGWEVGVLVPVDLQPPVKSATPNAAVAERIKQVIAAHPGQYSKTALRDKRSGKTGELKASKSEVAAAIEDLLAAGEIVTREPTPEERRMYDLPQQTKAVLDIPPRAHATNAANIDEVANHAARN
ncbi:MAG: AAA family ATPase [Rhodoferax sp.]|nr:AAA family ATPase [Rhodoferax sp.]